MADAANEEELLDYEEDEVPEAEAVGKAGQEKKGYVGIHATGFKELMLKPELLQAITDCGFEHPSEGARRHLYREAARATGQAAAGFAGPAAPAAGLGAAARSPPSLWSAA